jgi:hypothetical protein
MAHVRVDDLDHTVHSDETPVRTWHFGHGPANQMTTYTVDLTQENYEKLVSALQQFIDLPGAEEVSRSAPLAASPARGGGNKGRTKQIREWALANGHTVADRGRIPDTIQEAYRKAQKSSS